MRWLVPLLALWLIPQTPNAQSAQPTAGQSAKNAPPASVSVAMSPSEAFEYASQPIDEARSQPNDLTEADKWALAVTLQRAGEACREHTPYKSFDEQLLSVGKLCILGQQFEQAAEALVPYLSVPNSKYEEGALLLVRAYIGMNEPTAAESQLETLLARFPYDAGIHFGIDNFIDAAEGRDKTDDDLIQRLNAQQLPFMLKALAAGELVTYADKSEVVPAAMLFQDSLRCAAQLRADGKQKDADEVLGKLEQITAAPRYAQSSQLPEMLAALKRYRLVGTLAPIKTLRAHLVPRGGDVTRTALQQHLVNLQGKATVLIVVALSAPASIDVATKIVELLKASPGRAAPVAIYAVTSYTANGGNETNPAPGIMQGLRGFADALPTSVPLYLLDNANLQTFSIDRFPMALAVDAEGRIRFLAPLVTEGDDRLLKQAATRPKPGTIVVQVEAVDSQ